MIHPIGFMVRLLTKAAGMPVGKGGNLDWHALVKEAGLQVVSLQNLNRKFYANCANPVRLS